MKGDKWAVEDLGHCSCYGPAEQMKLDRWYDSLEDIPLSGTQEWYNDVAPCIEAAKGRQ